ncbi:MAG: metallophosphoesterase [Spirochaetaceae bacterium]|nr:MAG: metallophosphoesterase [Spirochaetaceae bacterium]
MKILCIADNTDPVVYSDNIRNRFSEVDCIIACGDLPLSYYDFIVSNLNRPLYFVFGNHHLKWIGNYDRWHRKTTPEEDLLKQTREWGMGTGQPSGIEYIDGRVIHRQGLIIAGLGGSMLYNKGPHQYTDRQMLLRILKIMPRLIFNRIFFHRACDILVTHAPPLGIHDLGDLCHKGFKCFLWFMRVFKPRYLIHGHIHLWEYDASRKADYQQTTVINAYNHTILEV